MSGEIIRPMGVPVARVTLEMDAKGQLRVDAVSLSPGMAIVSRGKPVPRTPLPVITAAMMLSEALNIMIAMMAGGKTGAKEENKTDPPIGG